MNALKISRRFIFFTSCGLFLLLLFIFIALLLYAYRKPQTTQHDSQYVVLPHETLSTFIIDLGQRHIIAGPSLALTLAATLDKGKTLKSGQYHFKAHASLKQIMDEVTRHQVQYHAVTLIDGWTFQRLYQHLAANPYLLHDISANGYALMRNITNQSLSAEGEFLPQTYFVTNHSSESALLVRAHQALQQVLLTAWQQRDKRIPIHHASDALIMASLVELEARDPREMPVIASVFYNRLRAGMRLQSDPTVWFASHQPYGSHISYADLRANSFYNTYRYAGLPPSPIALPSQAAIDAVLHPAHTDYLYFVAKGGGHHQFSHTLAEQRLAISRYG